MLNKPLQRVVLVEPDEVRPVLFSALYLFLIMAGYFIIRPLRDEVGVAGGVRNLPRPYTVLPRETNYKAKNFIDTFVYRAGDQVGAWSYAAMGWLGLGMAGIAFAAVPLAGAWMGVGLWLGRKQAVMSRESTE